MDRYSTNIEAAAHLARETDPGDWADEPSAADLHCEACGLSADDGHLPDGKNGAWPQHADFARYLPPASDEPHPF